MAEPSVQQLFRQWRGGDAEAGQAMAQKFSDWYYAVTTIRVADKTGREPLERACQAFAQGIVSVTRPSALVDWAHDLLERELKTINRGLDAGPATGGDFPNALTDDKSPTDLIHQAVSTMDQDHVQLLASAYDKSIDLTELERAGEALGGLPFAMLDARYALKRALHETNGVRFAVLPTEADMDRAPISLYEAGRLATQEEVSTLEKWLLTDIDLCKDIAEFAAFVHAIRGGAIAAETQAGVSPPPKADPTTSPAPAAEASKVDDEDAIDESDLLVDPEDESDLLVDPQDDEGGEPPEDDTISDDVQPAAAQIRPADPQPPPSRSTFTSIMWIAAVLICALAGLLALMFWGLR